MISFINKREVPSWTTRESPQENHRSNSKKTQTKRDFSFDIKGWDYYN